MSEWLHPAGPFVLGAVVASIAPAAVRRLAMMILAAAGLGLAWTLPEAAQVSATVMGLPIVPIRVDRLARPFAIIFALVALLAMLYGTGASRRFQIAACAATAAALGIVLAGDWVTLYVAWEGLAIASCVLVSDGATNAATRAAFRYLLIHLAGGALLLGGIAWRRASDASLFIEPLPFAGPAALILLGFVVNAAVPPLHAWLTDAYPESSPAAGVVLSAFATKAAVYALARVFPGVDLLVWAGVTMALYGVVFAVLENDIRRLLGYHIVSQVGYMVAGVGLGTPLALSGAVAHAFCHILYKGLLFMGTGAVIETTGRRRLTDLGGLGRRMPLTFTLYMVGALSISGAPLLNGFVSKSLIIAAAWAEHAEAVAVLLTLAAVGTFLSVGLKLPAFTFGGADRGLQPTRVPPGMVIGMTAAAALCLVIGVFPAPLYAVLPHAVTYEPYTTAHVLEALQILVGTSLGALLVRRMLKGTGGVTRDFDRLYRAIGALLARVVAPTVARAADALEAAAGALVTLPYWRVSADFATPVGYAVLVAVGALGVGLAVFVTR
jgi:multicomponent Na+:H+ antiporter subunit D